MKLRDNEVVLCDDLDTYYQVCRQADSLGLKWEFGGSYLSLEKWLLIDGGICLDLCNGTCLRPHKTESLEKTIITATEWLNRHNIFLAGQNVYASDVSYADAYDKQRIYIYVAPETVVAPNYTAAYYQGYYFNTVASKYITSTFPIWEDDIVEIQHSEVARKFKVNPRYLRVV